MGLSAVSGRLNWMDPARTGNIIGRDIFKTPTANEIALGLALPSLTLEDLNVIYSGSYGVKMANSYGTVIRQRELVANPANNATAHHNLGMYGGPFPILAGFRLVGTEYGGTRAGTIWCQDRTLFRGSRAPTSC